MVMPSVSVTFIWQALTVANTKLSLFNQLRKAIILYLQQSQRGEDRKVTFAKTNCFEGSGQSLQLMHQGVELLLKFFFT